MRILVYPHDLEMGGSQTNAIELAAAVTKLGHECMIFGRRGTLCERIDELGLTFIESPDPSWRPSPRIARGLRTIVVERGIDVIHGYEWPPGLEGAIAAETLPEVAAVCTVMSMAVAPFLPRWLPLAVGTQQISALEQSAGRLNVSLLEPPVDLEHNRPMETAAAEAFKMRWGLDDRPLVVCVSRLVPELKSEGILTAIEVAGDLADRLPFQLVIVGDGKSRDAMEEAAERTNRRIGRQTVVFTGELTDPRPAYNAADIVLGMGGSALRALAFGKPLVVQGEHGYFRTLTPESVDQFRWHGWYGVGEGTGRGRLALSDELSELLSDPRRRAELGVYGRSVVEDFSLERAAKRQVTIYRDALASRAAQKGRVLATGRSFLGLAAYYVGQRLDHWRGRHRADDFNSDPVAVDKSSPAVRGAEPAPVDGPILYFPAGSWDAPTGPDRQLATALARDCPVIWVEPAHPILSPQGRAVPPVSHPHANLVRLRGSRLGELHGPYLRDIADWRRAEIAKRYLSRQGLSPRAVMVSATTPMLNLTRGIPGKRVYYATGDFVEAAEGRDARKRYLSRSREANLVAADIAVAVTPELARHIQRRSISPHWLPNGVDLVGDRESGGALVKRIPLERPIAGVVGQFSSRIDLPFLEAVQSAGISLLLVGPRNFASGSGGEAFDRLVRMPGVHWIDRQPTGELSAYVDALDVGLTPYSDSMLNRRAFPLETLAYLSSGVPVVTTDVPSHDGLDPEFVMVASTPAEFVDRVTAVAASAHDRSEIRRSVGSSDWETSAAQLLAWLREEGTR